MREIERERGIELEQRGGLRRWRGQRRKMSKRRKSRDEMRHLTGALPEVDGPQVGRVGPAAEKVTHRMVVCFSAVGLSALRAGRGRQSIDSEQVVTHGRGETRPELRQGGPIVARELRFTCVDRGSCPFEDSVWGGRRDGIGHRLAVDRAQRVTVGDLGCEPVQEVVLNGRKETREEGRADAAGARIRRDHRPRGMATAESTQQVLAAEHRQLPVHRQHPRLDMEVVLRGHKEGSGGYAKGRILDRLKGL